MSEEQPRCECGETTDPLHDCDRKEREDHERRERYAAAINENAGWVMDDGQHMLDAVMAVADAEIKTVGRELLRTRAAWAKSENENTRLRAELKEANVQRRNTELDCAKRDREINRLRAELEALHQQCSDDREEALRLREASDAEIERLRTELDREKGRADDYNEYGDRLEATIARVRDAARKAQNGRNVWDMEDLIRAALDKKED